MESFKISDIRDLFAADLERFVSISRAQIARLLAEDPAPREALDEVIRQAHTLKGLAGTVQAWGLARWGEDLETLMELAETFLATDRDRADQIFNFFLQHLDGWHVMNQFTLAELFPQAWEHYLGLRGLMTKHWRDYLSPLPLGSNAPNSGLASPASVARPTPLPVLPPNLRRRSASRGQDAKGNRKSETPTTASPAAHAPELKLPAQSVTAGGALKPAGAALPRIAPPVLKRQVRKAFGEPVSSEAAAPVSALPTKEIPQSPEPILEISAEMVPTPACPTVDLTSDVASPDADLLQMLGQEVSGYLEELKTTLIQLAANLTDAPKVTPPARLSEAALLTCR